MDRTLHQFFRKISRQAADKLESFLSAPPVAYLFEAGDEIPVVCILTQNSCQLQPMRNGFDSAEIQREIFQDQKN